MLHTFDSVDFESLLLSENQLLFDGSYTLDDEPLENKSLDGDKNHPLNFSLLDSHFAGWDAHHQAINDPIL